MNLSRLSGFCIKDSKCRKSVTDCGEQVRPLLSIAPFIVLFILVVGLQYPCSSQKPGVESKPAAPVRERLLMDFGWRFAFGHLTDAMRDFRNGTRYFSYMTKAGFGDGPAAKEFDDRSWRMLSLPHDWAVELPFDPQASYSHGFKTVGRKFPETTVGWYRKTFAIPQSDSGRRISIQFDGVHRNSIVWVNGFYLGQEHSGYYSFEYDVTDYLNYGGENVVAVRVDASMEEGWFYEGAGVYRHAWLLKTSPLHVAPSGTFVSSETRGKSADITARTTIVNDGRKAASFILNQTIIDSSSKIIGSNTSKLLTLTSGESQEYSCVLRVENPALWSVDSPHLYSLATSVETSGIIVDRYVTPFGIRTIRFDAQKGFFLNDKHFLLKGTNNHQDHAGVGTAIPDALLEFRIKRLKEMGANAYRCSHNPPAPELLDACDRLGMLVIDENRLIGSNEEHLEHLKRMIVRDRNHPSVFIWSIGNEEWAAEGNETGARIAMTMQAYAQRLDPTRRITYPNSGGWGNGISTVQDVMGFNYIFNGNIDLQHARFPNQPAMGTEETTSRSTRGIYEDDTAHAHMMAIDRKPSGHSIEEGMKFYAARPFLSGIFFWTGFDYRGEPHPFGWPQVTSQSGIVDLCGFPKDMFYYLKSWWTEIPVLHLLPHWNWKGGEGKNVSVWAYSNCDEVELYLNGKSVGRRNVTKNSHAEWMVPYEPGTLIARGYRNGREIISDKVETTDDASVIQLSADRSSIQADNEDVSVITVEVSDSAGRIVPTAGNEITFDLQGPGKIIGVGNGDPSSHEPDRFFDHVKQLTIEHLKVKLVRGETTYPETNIEFDDSGWESPLNEQGEYHVAPQESLHTVVIRGTFEVSGKQELSEVVLWPKSLCEVQDVYVNGHLIAKGIRRDDPLQHFAMDKGWFREGRNVYAVVGTPQVVRFLYDNLNTDPGVIETVTHAGAWKRRAFNGLAQVIVQSTRLPGELVLTATSIGLSTSVLKIRTMQANLRPAVSE